MADISAMSRAELIERVKTAERDADRIGKKNDELCDEIAQLEEQSSGACPSCREELIALRSETAELKNELMAKAARITLLGDRNSAMTLELATVTDHLGLLVGCMDAELELAALMDRIEQLEEDVTMAAPNILRILEEARK